MGRACNTNGGGEECIWDIAWKARRKETTMRPSLRWPHNVKLDHRETGWDGMDGIDLAQVSVQWRALANTQ
jgi:hypothetical protein